MNQDRFLDTYKKERLRACQLKQVAILERIDRICKKHGIDYWLDGGTLLGAVRHGGFIPWDDDIDVAMKKEDLPRFIAATETELPAFLVLQFPEDKHDSQSVIKIRDLNSFFISRDDDLSKSYPKGVFVDIFPFVDYPSVGKKWIRFVAKGICASHAVLTRKHSYSLYNTMAFFYFECRYLLCRILWFLSRLLRPCDKYLSNTLHNNWYGIMHEKKAVFPTREIMFEGKTFMAPADPDRYLRDLYGEYMTLPPEEKRISHALYFIPELIVNQDKQS
ncbi:MAG: LicD family protein [Bacteroidales bacterium]|nr:LicD family protein [Bacteroidales bacterium]MDE7072856.1 LicD family protein [Bacteroidales bacterium]